MFEKQYDEWGNEITPDLNKLRYVRKGVLWVQGNPHYIVELIREHGVAFVQVYDVHPNTRDNPKKLADEVVSKVGAKKETTLLGQLANRLKPPKKKKQWVARPPVFVAPVVHGYTSTFTGQIDSGFFERAPDRFDSVGGEKVFVRGENTGVFVGLSSVIWDSRTTIPMESLVEVLTEKGNKESGFYDLEGTPNEANPLKNLFRGQQP
jgi:hypothetical protein